MMGEPGHRPRLMERPILGRRGRDRLGEMNPGPAAPWKVRPGRGEPPSRERSRMFSLRRVPRIGQPNPAWIACLIALASLGVALVELARHW